jgi:hypothetical protein
LNHRSQCETRLVNQAVAVFCGQAIYQLTMKTRVALMQQMANVEVKLREAQLALDKMRDQDQRAFGDTHFDDYLSAFLNAARTVDYRLRCEYPATYPTWRDEWNAKHPNDDARIKFISDARRKEVHASGSGRKVKTKEVNVGVGGSYTDKGGSTLYVMGSPTPLTEGNNTGATIHMQQYFFEMEDGTDRTAVDVCTEGLAALTQMVDEFRIASQSSP